MNYYKCLTESRSQPYCGLVLIAEQSAAAWFHENKELRKP
jgi:hypothetical protein